MVLVSVIIPTLRRPQLVLRAVRSVLAQTVRDLEVVVVLDGPDPTTETALATLPDPRLHLIVNAASIGAGAARNLAAAAARGQWLAFLDDDDAWEAEKLELQLKAAGDDAKVLVSCRSRVMTPHGSYVWPRTLYDGRCPIDEYLFDRRSLTRGDTHVGTSSFFMSKALFEQTRFGTTRQQEDNTLLLRVTKQAGGRVLMIPQTMVVLYKEEARESLGSAYDWRDMLGWIDSMGGLITPRAYSGFCLTYLGPKAAQHGDYAGFFDLLRTSFKKGAPTAMQLGPFLMFWIVPAPLRRRLRALTGSRRRSAAGPMRTPAA